MISRIIQTEVNVIYRSEAELKQCTSGNIPIEFLFIDHPRLFGRPKYFFKYLSPAVMTKLNFRRIFCEYGYFKVFMQNMNYAWNHYHVKNKNYT